MSAQNGHSTESVKEMVDLTKPAATPARTAVPQTSAEMPKSMPAPIRDLNVSQTFNITINLPQHVGGYPAVVPTPSYQDRPVIWMFAIAAILATLAILVAFFGPSRVFMGPIQVPAAVVRTSGTIDINQVAIGDQGIDWFNPVNPGIYPLRQNSTGLFITEGGNTILVDKSGLRAFR